MSRASPSSSRRAAGSAAGARRARADGAVTRAGLLETAGRLFAERGYQGTTGKAICERAGVNMAAVNYHFGSREGLYLAVLKEVQQRVVSVAFLRALARDGLAPEQQLRAFLRELVAQILDGEQWPIRVWAREVLAPSPWLDQVMREEAQPKFQALAAVVAGITGLPADDARLPPLVLGVIAPCLVLLVAGREHATPIQPLFGCDAEALADQFWRFGMAGLHQAQAQLREGPAQG